VPGQVPGPFGGGGHAVAQAGDGIGGCTGGARGQGVDGDGGEQGPVGRGDGVLAAGVVDGGGEGPQPLAGGVQCLPLPGGRGRAAGGGEGDVGAVAGGLLGEGAEVGEQGPVEAFAGDGQGPG